MMILTIMMMKGEPNGYSNAKEEKVHLPMIIITVVIVVVMMMVVLVVVVVVVMLVVMMVVVVVVVLLIITMMVVVQMEKKRQSQKCNFEYGQHLVSQPDQLQWHTFLIFKKKFYPKSESLVQIPKVKVNIKKWKPL